jgi:hypothetical protein
MSLWKRCPGSRSRAQVTSADTLAEREEIMQRFAAEVLLALR